MPSNVVMEHIWDNLLPERYKKTVTDPAYLKGLLVGAYGQPSRLYHDVAHLSAMLGALKKTPLGCTTSMYTAILFHDAVYEIKAPAGQNEDLSFTFFMDEAAHVLIDPDLDHIHALIMATKHDRDLGSDYEGPHHLDPSYEQKLIADLDMSGFQRPSFLSDHIAVVGEYYRGGYTKQEVAEGRLKFLKALVERRPFYYHKDLFDAGKARSNIKLLIKDTEREIANLRAGERRATWTGQHLTMDQFKRQKETR